MMRTIFVGLLGVIVGILIQFRFMMVVLKNKDRRIGKLKTYFTIFDQWMFLKQHNISVGDYLLSKGIKTIGIYGMGIMGMHAFDELNNTCIVKFGMDQADKNINGLIMLSFKDKIPYVDALIVTPGTELEKICNNLHEKTSAQILVWGDVIKACYEEKNESN